LALCGKLDLTIICVEIQGRHKLKKTYLNGQENIFVGDQENNIFGSLISLTVQGLMLDFDNLAKIV
jgi:hypothetical protein